MLRLTTLASPLLCKLHVCDLNHCQAVPQTVLALKGFLLIPGFTEVPQTKEGRLRGGSYLASIELPLYIKICCRGLLA